MKEYLVGIEQRFRFLVMIGYNIMPFMDCRGLLYVPEYARVPLQSSGFTERQKALKEVSFDDIGGQDSVNELGEALGFCAARFDPQDGHSPLKGVLWLARREPEKP